MKVKDYDFNKPIKTTEELEQYVGKPIYLWYEERRGPMARLETKFAWIKTIYEVTHYPNERNMSIVHRPIMGYNALCVVKDFQEHNSFIYKDDYNKPLVSNGQTFIRTLTEEEFEMYRKKTIKRRWLMEN